jgi:spore coat protein A
LLGALALAAPGLRAATVEVVATRDNTLYEDATGSLSNGGGSYVFAGNTGQTDPAVNTRRALVRFDLAAAVPAGSTVTAATLTLFLSKASSTTPQTVTVHRVLADWGEGTSNDTQGEGSGSPAVHGDATWLHTFFDHDFWASPGGDFTATASASTSVGTAGSAYSWTSTGLRDDVQAWVNQATSNRGWLLRGNETASRTSKRFSSREDTADGGVRRPRLLVTFTPPAGTGGCCSATGSCTLGSSQQCSGLAGVFQGAGSVCSPNPCPQPTGACCANGACQRITAAACAVLGGAYKGDGTTCATANCATGSGACCLPGTPGSCGSQTQSQCTAAGGSFLGAGTACGVDLCPFVDPLTVPPVAQPASGTAGGAASYRLAAVETRLQLHRDLPPTTLWTYGGSYPGPTIEAHVGEPVHVLWQNDLRDERGALRTEHLLPVDTCLHGPDHHGTGAVTVTHLHGGHVPAASDGYPEDTLAPGESDLYDYPNQQLPATLWYHDHALGITRLNVYLGLAGMYLLRDDAEAALGLPSGEHEIPLVIQDRSFRADGALDYPATWQEHVFGSKILVNGKVWPYLEVDRGKYRFRILNAANARTLRLALSNGATFHQIGTDGGLLPAPVPLTQLTLTPAERADVVVDFSSYAPGTVLRLVNDAPAPFPGTPGVGVVPNVLELRVGSEVGYTAPLPPALRSLEVLREQDAVKTRTFELAKRNEACAGAEWTINGIPWEQVTEYPVLGTTEIWRFVNRSGMVHPMHMHLVQFQVLDRQPFTIVNGKVTPVGSPTPPPANERGWKDTTAVYPFEITRVIARFETYPGLFAYHCHVLEHEDHDMMRQFQTVAAATEACVADDDTLCLDNAPDDHRFKVEVDFATTSAGGLSGKAHAISLADKGVRRGGLFWFFSPENPELLIKVLDGCAINDRFWVYFSAGTDVGLTLRVTDTVTGLQFVRTNPDHNPVPTVQDVSALPCHP